MGRPKNPPPARGEELQALEAAWEERGADAIQAIRNTDQIGYVRMIVLALGLDLDDD